MMHHKVDAPPQGTTLREWYAGLALAGLLAAGTHRDVAARHARKIADDMLDELSDEEPQE